MWKLHRYYLRELTVNAAITLTVLFAVVLISLVARGLQRAQGGGLLDAALIMLFWAMDAFPHLLTIGFLLAIVLTFARAVQDRELVAIRSAGIPPRVPMTAALLVGIALSIIGSLANHYVLPAVHFRKYRIISEVARNVFLNMNLGADWLRFPNTNIVVRFRNRDQERGFLDCTLYAPEGKIKELAAVGLTSPIISVDRIFMPRPDERSETLSIVLQGLEDTLNETRYEGPLELMMSLRAVSERNRRSERDDDLTSDQLLSEVVRDVHEAPTAARYTLNRRSCFSLMPFLLAPIGFCIAQLAYYRGRMLALVSSIVPLAVFYIGDVLGAKLLRTTDWPVFGWLPAILLVVLGTPFCIRMLRQ